MGTILASAILNNASVALNDVAQVRWTQSELLGYLNDAQRAAAAVRPDLSVETRSFPLTAGATKQSIPTDALSLVEPVRNMGADGLTAGMPITFTDRNSLDSVQPTWHSDANALGYVRHVVKGSDMRVFYVYPKAPTTWNMEAVFAVTPSDVPTAGSPIALDDVYAPALEFYVLGKAYGKNKSDAASLALSDGYFAKFASTLGPVKA